MVKKQTQEWISFYEEGIRYMQCKHCKSEYVEASKNAVAVMCVMCVQRKCISEMSLEEMMPSLRRKVTTGRPAGWHFMNEFVDKDGNVFHKGKEQPKLKGTLKPTKVKPRKKKKKLTADEKLHRDLNKWKKRKKARRGK
jgi:hypothetical protein|tara:strand:- start:69 stop:485 length:417 start_codon:yes stop_codon:yes gene_type:complete